MTPKRNGNGIPAPSSSHERRSWNVYVTFGLLLVLLTTLLFWNGQKDASLLTWNDFTEPKTTSTHKTVGYRFVLNQTVEDARLKAQYAAGNEIPLCRRYQIITGQWLAVNYSHPPYVPTVQHLRCYPAGHYHQSPYPSYQWMPDLAAIGHCHFDDYDAARLCALLPRATIAIVGDSLSFEQYRSLVSLHHVQTHQGYQFQSFELQQNIQQALCEGTTTVVYRRDDYLQNLTASIQEHFPTVLVLNRGSHYVPDQQLVREMKGLIKEIKSWLRQCDDWKIECYFFWRTSVPGHMGCNTTAGYTTPVYDVHDIEQQLIQNQSLYNEISREYHWHDFQHQNELILKLLRQAELSNFQVLDAYHLNVLRPDEHRAHQGDCLHNCFPGKMDVYNRLLLHYLQMQRSENDIQRLQVVAQQKKWPVTVEDTVYDEAATKQAKDARLQREAEALAAAGVVAEDSKDNDDEEGKGNSEKGSKRKEAEDDSEENDAEDDAEETDSEDAAEENEDEEAAEENDEDEAKENSEAEDEAEENDDEDDSENNDDEGGLEDIDGEDDPENQ
jgi:GDSL/SGNH-like Acyl-Esterase family found in Pmr5 and Cas1p